MIERSEENSLFKWALVCVLAVFTGAGGGLGAVAFRKAIDLFQWLFFGNLLNFTSYLTWHGFNCGIILLPIIGGLMIGPIIFKFCNEAKGHGVPEIIEPVYFNEGRSRKRVAVQWYSQSGHFEKHIL
jgi:CIC family chloride channel protein